MNKAIERVNFGPTLLPLITYSYYHLSMQNSNVNKIRIDMFQLIGYL